jgi:hypothetical protein
MAIDKSYEDFFSDSSKEKQIQLIANLAKFKSKRVGLEHYRKVVKARLMKQFEPQFRAVAVQEREAYAHPEYIQIIEALEIATEEETKAWWSLEMLKLEIDVWRTEQANNRRLDH